jgi:UDP:flavonoid glycosyltransferase YjiC (YdhE family)
MNESVNIRSNGKRILFACVPAEGHFNPLTGLAKHLKSVGYDVRWYTAARYEKKLQELGIPFYGFDKAVDMMAGEPDTAFPERAKLKSQVGKLNFDMEHFFIKRGPEYFADIQEIHKTFAFDLLIADVTFTGTVFVKDLMKIPVIAIGVMPLIETSKDLAPTGLGMEPSEGFFGRMKQAVLRYAVKNILFRKPNKIMHRILDEYGIVHNNIFLFDLLSKKANYILQSGTPGFEYKRSDLGKNVRFIGSLLPYSSSIKKQQWFDERLNKYKRVVLVTQGTVEKDVNKIIVPTLEAFKNTDTLVVCTTGGSQTSALKAKYSQDNIIIEDFIPFKDVMPYAHAYITNGGYGGVMLGIENKLPLVVAGVHEGKNEICARVGYFKYGINLKTETPLPAQIKEATDEVINNNLYKQNINKLGEEFTQYQPNELCAKYVGALLQPEIITKEVAKKLASVVY